MCSVASKNTTHVAGWETSHFARERKNFPLLANFLKSSRFKREKKIENVKYVFAVISCANGLHLQRVLANQTKRAWVTSAKQVQTYI